jgi:hypothetical protein
MTLNDAIKLLSLAGHEAFISRSNGTRVRNAIGHDEQRLARYVVDTAEGAKGYNASADDVRADDWEFASSTTTREEAPTTEASQETSASEPEPSRPL